MGKDDDTASWLSIRDTAGDDSAAACLDDDHGLVVDGVRLGEVR